MKYTRMLALLLLSLFITGCTTVKEVPVVKETRIAVALHDSHYAVPQTPPPPSRSEMVGKTPDVVITKQSQYIQELHKHIAALKGQIKGLYEASKASAERIEQGNKP